MMRSLLRHIVKASASVTLANSAQIEARCNYAKKAAQTEKPVTKYGFRVKTSIKGTLFEYHDVTTSMQYMKSEGSSSSSVLFFLLVVALSYLLVIYISNFQQR